MRAFSGWPRRGPRMGTGAYLLPGFASRGGSTILNWANLAAGNAIHAWDFRANQARFNNAELGPLSATPNWTFTRASTGYAQTSGGVLVPFASGELRRTDKGVLIEGAGTNLFTQSADFSHADWAKTLAGTGVAPSVTANYAAAPDGTTTADRVQFSLGGGTATADISIIRQQNSTTGAITSSFYVKSTDGASSYNMQIIDPSGNGVAITVTGSWQRVSSSGTSAAAVNYGIRLRGGQTPTNPNTADILIWGAQLEATAYASSYVPTTTGSATRAADSLTVTGVTGLDYPLSLYAEFERGVDTGGVEEFLNVDSGSTANRGRILIDATDDPRAVMTTAAAAVANISGFSVLSAGAVRKFAARFATDNVNAASNGTLGTTDTSATAPSTPTTIRFGANASGANYCYGYLRRAAIFSRALSDGELQALTTA